VNSSSACGMIWIISFGHKLATRDACSVQAVRFIQLKDDAARVRGRWLLQRLQRVDLGFLDIRKGGSS
jgi:hypothetical protein